MMRKISQYLRRKRKVKKKTLKSPFCSPETRTALAIAQPVQPQELGRKPTPDSYGLRLGLDFYMSGFGQVGGFFYLG